MQRVIIAQALVKEAEIYFFDEPMSALDPESQRDFLKMATELSKSGNTVVFTTHNPSHALSLENVRKFYHDCFDWEISDDEIEKLFYGAVLQ